MVDKEYSEETKKRDKWPFSGIQSVYTKSKIPDFVATLKKKVATKSKSLYTLCIPTLYTTETRINTGKEWQKYTKYTKFY